MNRQKNWANVPDTIQAASPASASGHHPPDIVANENADLIGLGLGMNDMINGAGRFAA